MQKIHFYSFDRHPSLKERKKLKDFIANVFYKEKKGLISLSCIFCSDEHLLKINKDFLNHDFYTDVITFDLSNQSKIEGEIYLSIDRIKENAKQGGISFNEEFHRVIFHGVLHLCGYKDKNKEQLIQMRLAEDKYLCLYFNRFHVEHKKTRNYPNNQFHVKLDS